jgi:hypothetical protein
MAGAADAAGETRLAQYANMPLVLLAAMGRVKSDEAV